MKCRMFVDTPKLHLSEARQIEFVNRYFRENTRNHKDRGGGEGKGSSGSPFPPLSMDSKYLHLDRPMY